MTIREISQEDQRALILLVYMTIGDSNNVEVAAELVDEFYSNELFSTYVIENNGEIESYIAYKRNPFEGSNNIGEIVFLGTNTISQRKGYGKILVARVEDLAREEGIRKIYIKTNPHNKKAICFWINNDYQFEARLMDYSLDGVDAYFMGKDL